MTKETDVTFSDIKRAATLYAYHLRVHSIVSKIEKVAPGADGSAYIVALFPVGMQKNIKTFLQTDVAKTFLEDLTKWDTKH